MVYLDIFKVLYIFITCKKTTMKKHLVIPLLVLAFFRSNAQKISDASSLEQAVTLSEKQRKPMLVIVNLPAQHKHPIKSAHLEDDIIKKIKSQFLVFETTVEDRNITPILSLYKIHNLPAFLFMHSNKDVFYSETGASTYKGKYLEMLNKATLKSKEVPIIVDIEKSYLANKTDNEIIKKYIELRKQRGITDNAELIEQFAKNLKLEDFKDYKTVLFVLSCGPYAYGNAYKLAYSNRKITDSIYKFEPLKTRVDMNNAIISNTLQNAIKTKNANQAHYAASFAKATYGKNINMGNRVYSSNMISYHKAVNDTTCYFRLAIPFYDRYYMMLSADSIKKGEEKRRISFAEKNFKKPNENAKVVTKSEFDSIRKQLPTTAEQHTTYMVVSENGNNTYATTLNNVAWSFYETGTRNINYLTKAMLWSRRSIELEPNAAYYDTLAHLLYRLGYETEAIKTQENAIAQAKIQKANFEHMQGELKKMKNKTL